MVEAAFELVSFGPTSANCEPLRLVLLPSPQTKEKAKPLAIRNPIRRRLPLHLQQVCSEIHPLGRRGQPDARVFRWAR
jgi:hypothetical protein